MPVSPRANRAAIIDIGSNSIKLLVAERSTDSSIRTIEEGIEETRISTGIARSEPRLRQASMESALQAISRLHQASLLAGADRVCVTATSAVRDATNSGVFADLLRAETGLDLRILSGLEEAKLIAAGVRTDPDLMDLKDFVLVDLGGGSLEILAIEGNDITSMDSLPLGCVRLTEHFVPDPDGPLSVEDRGRIEQHVETIIRQSAFTFDSTPGHQTELVVTGGTATVALFLGKTTPANAPGPLTFCDLEKHLDVLSALPLQERRTYPGLPEGRADIFPTALATLITVFRMGGFRTARHSFRNLRYGLAARMLEDSPG